MESKVLTFFNTVGGASTSIGTTFDLASNLYLTPLQDRDIYLQRVHSSSFWTDATSIRYGDFSNYLSVLNTIERVNIGNSVPASNQPIAWWPESAGGIVFPGCGLYLGRASSLVLNWLASETFNNAGQVSITGNISIQIAF